MKTVYILIGLPGSGKSTFTKSHLKSIKTVELDEVRQTLSDQNIIGKQYSSNDNAIVFEHFYKQINNTLNDNDEVVVDSTNAKLSERTTLYTMLENFKPKYIAVNFICDKQVAIDRILKRQKENPNCVHVFQTHVRRWIFTRVDLMKTQ